MCGRYALSTPPEILAELLRVHAAQCAYAARATIAPTDIAPVLRVSRGAEREIVAMRWGLVPFWAKDVKIGSKLINARSETAAEKPAFRSALRRRRCVIPATGFFEWKKLQKGKQPYFIHRADGAPVLFAGLWESWNDPQRDSPLETFTILTTAANEAIAPLHGRMPVILETEQCDAWLDPACDRPEALQQHLRPAADGVLAFHPVERV